MIESALAFPSIIPASIFMVHRLVYTISNSISAPMPGNLFAFDGLFDRLNFKSDNTEHNERKIS